MSTVCIITPHFPPISAPDMQRVRMSLPYFAAFGWQPVVLAVEPAYVEGIEESALLATVPSEVPIRRVRALPARWTRRVGVSNLGLRALPFLYAAGRQMIKQYQVDLVYFSTTLFPTMVLGRIWKAQFNVPFVFDMQDPWVSDYYETRPRAERPPKYWYVQRIHRFLEAWSMPKVDGIIAVSRAYHETLCDRYPSIPPQQCHDIPFAGARLDYEAAAQDGLINTYFKAGDGLLHGVYAGVLGRVMKQTCLALCLALQKGLAQYPEPFSRVRLHFVGTHYAMDGRAAKTIEPIAIEMGLGDYVQEDTQRIPYLAVLNLLQEADFLLLPGSDNPHYTASKVYPYILAKKPLLAVFHESSSVVEVLRSTQAGEVVTFASDSQVEHIADALLSRWRKVLLRLPYQPPTDWQAFEPYTAREMTRRQCAVFDRIVSTEPSVEHRIPVSGAPTICR